MSGFISLRSYSNETCSHSHDFAQLVLPIKGQLELEIDGKAGSVNETKGACIGSEAQHCFASSQDNLFLVVDFPRTNTINHITELPSFLHLDTTIQKYVSFAHSYLEKKQDSATDHLLYQLLIKLLTPASALYDRSVILAKRWINEQCTRPIDIAQLAQHCHLSKSQLQRRFKQSTGFSLAEYWRIKKLEHAQLLLTNSNSPIEEIAYHVGYENLPAFSRRFTLFYGISPSQWRNVTLAAKNMRLKDNKNPTNN